MKKTNAPELNKGPKRTYEKPQLIWEDDFKAVAYAPIPSCAKQPLQSGICDSRPTA